MYMLHRSQWALTSTRQSNNGIKGLSVEGGNLSADDTITVSISGNSVGKITVTASDNTVVFTTTQTGKGFYSITADVSKVTDESVKKAWAGVTINFSVDQASTDGTYKAGAQAFTAGKNESIGKRPFFDDGGG